MTKETKRILIDPPSGWQYGFPKPVPEEYLGDQVLMTIWLIGEGYPSDQINLALKYSRYITESD